MTLKNIRCALVGLSAIAVTPIVTTATAQAQTAPPPTVAQSPILATFALANSDYATTNAGGTSVLTVAPSSLAPSLQSALLTVPQAGPGNAPGLTRAIFQDNNYGIIFNAYPSNQPTTDSSLGATTDAGAIQAGSYFTVSLTANNGSTFRVGRLLFDVGKGGATSDPRGYDIRSSVDNYSSSIDSTVLPTGVQPAPATDAIDLTTKAGYQSLSAITFRFYVYDSNPSGRTVDFRNIIVSSETAPEPGDLALLLIGIAPMALVVRRRRARKQA